MCIAAILNKDGGTLKTEDLGWFSGFMRKAFEDAGHIIDIQVIPGDALIETLETTENDPTVDAIVAGGGDSTISAAAGAAFRSSKALGVLPAGTMNLFARALGVPLELDQAVRALAVASPRAADYCRRSCWRHVVKLTVAPGEFVLEGDVIATVSKSADEETDEKLVGLLAIDSARSAEREIEFSIDLLVEIALRALSPGVNDAYTAIAAADSLSAALSDVAGLEAAPTGRCDEDGDPRLIVPGLAFDQLTARAFHPLRRASANNVLVAQSYRSGADPDALVRQ